MKTKLFIVLSIAAALLPLSSRCDDTPAKADIDSAKIQIHETDKLSVKFGDKGMVLTANTDVGSSWYWNAGGGDSWDNSDARAFSLDPTAHQNVLTIVVTDISSGANLLVGAFFFKDSTLVDGKHEILDATSGGLEITAPGTYTLDVSAAATKQGISGATRWKPQFWFSKGGAVGQTVTISSISVSSPATDGKIGTP